jgi:hypothetical protein
LGCTPATLEAFAVRRHPQPPRYSTGERSGLRERSACLQPCRFRAGHGHFDLARALAARVTDHLLPMRPCLQMEQVGQSAPRYAALRVPDCPRDHAAADRAEDVGEPRGQESVHEGVGSSPGEPGNALRAAQSIADQALRLPINAVVHRLAFDPSGFNVPPLADAVRLRQLESASFTPLAHSGLTGARKRSVVCEREVCASGDESRTSQDCPFHVPVSRVYGPKSECAQRRKRRPPAWMSTPGGPKLNPLEQSLGERATFIWGSGFRC